MSGFSAGQFVDSKYEIVRLVAEGGMGRVFLARDHNLQRDVALKILRVSEGASEDSVRRLRREARTLGRLRSPSTVEVYDVGAAGGHVYIVCQFVDGTTLAEVIGQGPLPEARVVHILLQVLDSLAEAHAVGVLHRDMKPGNVMVYDRLGEKDKVKVIDFGIAKPMDPSVTLDGTITNEGAVLGTALYMSPEQLRGRELTPATDLFSLGLVACEMLAGQRLIDEENRFDMWSRQTRGLSLVVPATLASPTLRSWLNRMLRTRASERFSDAGAAREALENVELESRAPAFLATREPNAGATRPGGQRAIFTLAGVSIVVALLGAWAISGVIGPESGQFGVSDGRVDEPPRSSQPLPRTRPEPALRPAVADPVPLDATVSAPPADTGDNADGERISTDEEERFGGDPCGGSPTVVERQLVATDLMTDRRKVRRNWTIIPPTRPPTSPRPVLMLVHESRRNGDQLLEYTRFQDLADEAGVVILAPDSIHDRGAAVSFRAWRAHNDYVFLKKMLEESAKLVCIDTERVYAFGHGRGGRIVEIFGALHHQLTAFATTGHRGEDPRYPARPVPYLRIDSLKNPAAPRFGGTGSCALMETNPPLAEIDEGWRQHYGCSTRAAWFVKDESLCEEHSCSKGVLVTCHVDGGRDWPGAPPAPWDPPGCAGTPADFPFRDVIWRFFLEHGIADG